MSLDSGLLYQRLMYVPGLTGTWRERADQYMRALTGKPYDGSLQTGLYLLDQISNRNFPQVAPAPAPAQEVQAQPVQQPLTAAEQAKAYADALTKAEQERVAKIQAIPTFKQQFGSLDTAWQGMVPQATLVAQSQVNPESIRQYNQAYEGYMGNLVNTGGQRFGRGFDGGGLSGIGNLKAGAERNRLGQIQDWLNAYKQGYQEMFYNPSQQAWEQSRNMGITPTPQDIQLPSWEDYYNQNSQIFDTGSSPFYG